MDQPSICSAGPSSQKERLVQNYEQGWMIHQKHGNCQERSVENIPYYTDTCSMLREHSCHRSTPHPHPLNLPIKLQSQLSGEVSKCKYTTYIKQTLCVRIGHPANCATWICPRYRVISVQVNFSLDIYLLQRCSFTSPIISHAPYNIT